VQPVRFGKEADSPGGFIAQPDGAGERPAVVVLPAIAGVTPYIERVCERLAKQGFITLALDYFRGNGAPDLSAPPKIMAAVAALPDRQVMSDLQAAVVALSELDSVDTQRIGVVGFCIGGSYAVMAAAETDGIACSAGFYGLLRYANVSDEKPVAPLETTSGLRHPLLAHFGDDDHLVPVEDVVELQARTKGKAAEVYRYPGAGHAFHEDFRDVYRPIAAQTAWLRTTVFLDWYLKGQKTLLSLVS
jgi:dienelactone hydrolase